VSEFVTLKIENRSSRFAKPEVNKSDADGQARFYLRSPPHPERAGRFLPVWHRHGLKGKPYLAFKDPVKNAIEK
jgi:hypothetical protein